MQTAAPALDPLAAAEEARRKDYSLVGRDTALAIDRGLAEADWYTSPVPRDACASCSNGATGRPSATRCCSSR